jgi:hypothetical protein
LRRIYKVIRFTDTTVDLKTRFLFVCLIILLWSYLASWLTIIITKLTDGTIVGESIRFSLISISYTNSILIIIICTSICWHFVRILVLVFKIISSRHISWATSFLPLATIFLIKLSLLYFLSKSFYFLLRIFISIFGSKIGHHQWVYCNFILFKKCVEIPTEFSLSNFEKLWISRSHNFLFRKWW